ncbi:MAG: pilus assembly protein PilM [Armatimonadetes bacterium]|nr:pilus assembly protein PilM [Armatimonadota bacterium]
MRTLGIEFGSAQLRVVTAENRRGRIQVHDAAALPLADEEEATAAAALSQFLEHHGRGVGQVVLGLPLRDSSVKLVSFPATSEENLSRLAEVEAAAQIPLPVDQVEFSHAIVDPGQPGGSATVAMVSARKELIARLSRPLQLAGLSASVIDVSAMALANLFAVAARGVGAPVGVANLEPEGGELVILDGGGRLRLVHALSAPDAALPEELRRTLQAFAASHGSPVLRLLLVGSQAGERVEGLVEALPCEVLVGDPWLGSREQKGMAGHAAAFAVATGLAARGGDVALKANLRPRATVQAAAERRQTSLVAAAMTVFFALFLAGCLWFYQAFHGRRLAVDEAQAKVVRLEEQLRQQGGDDPAYLGRLTLAATKVRRDTDWLELLRALTARLPGGVSLQELNIDVSRPLTLRGQAYSNAAIAQTIEVLNSLGRFDKVRLESADAQVIGTETVYNFQITCLWPASVTGRKEVKR